MDEETKAKVAVDKATAVHKDVEMGLINEDVLRDTRISQLIEDGFYPGLEDAVNEYGAEPEEPDVAVPWSRLAGAMAALGGPQAPPNQPPSGNGGGAPPAPQKPPNGGGGGSAPSKPPKLQGNVPFSQVKNYLTGAKDAATLTKSAVNYRDAPEGSEERCGNCSMYHAKQCTLVRGLIDPDDVCDRWAAKEPQKDAVGNMRTVQLIRHGATEYNNDKVSVDRLRGWKDIPLDKRGRDEAHKTAETMSKDKPDKILTSDLSRASETADIIAKKIGKNVDGEVKWLRPWSLGELSGQVTETALPTVRKHVDNPDKPLPGGGESFNAFKDRFFSGLAKCLEANPDDNLALVTHHRVERLLKAWKAAGYPADKSVDLDTFTQRGEGTGKAENFDIPADRL
jgi:broad specificity phosphatase PhoE